MAVRSSKKQLILERSASFNRDVLKVSDLRRVQQDLRQGSAAAKAPSLSYIANVLRQAGRKVEYEDRYSAPSIPEPYAGRLEGVLRFDALETTETSMRSLDAAYREYESSSDRAGLSLVRKLMLHGKQGAESLAANHRIRPEKRDEKREIASWFRIWLESPALFFDWLELRKQAQEFRELFPSAEVSEQAGSCNTPRSPAPLHTAHIDKVNGG